MFFHAPPPSPKDRSLNFQFQKSSAYYYKQPSASPSTVLRTRIWGKSWELGGHNDRVVISPRKRLEVGSRVVHQHKPNQDQWRYGSVLASIVKTPVFQERFREMDSSTRYLSNSNRNMTSPRVTIKIGVRSPNSPAIPVIQNPRSPLPGERISAALRMARKMKAPAVDTDEDVPAEKRECCEQVVTTPDLAVNVLSGHQAAVSGEEVSDRLERPAVNCRKRTAGSLPPDNHNLVAAKRTKVNEIICSYSSSRRMTQKVRRRRTVKMPDDEKETAVMVRVDECVGGDAEEPPAANKDGAVTSAKNGNLGSNHEQAGSSGSVDSNAVSRSRKQRFGIYENIKRPKSADGVYMPSYLSGVEDHVRDSLADRKRLNTLLGTKASSVETKTTPTIVISEPSSVTAKEPEVPPRPLLSPEFQLLPVSEPSSSNSTAGGFRYIFGTKEPEETSADVVAKDTNGGFTFGLKTVSQDGPPATVAPSVASTLITFSNGTSTVPQTTMSTGAGTFYGAPTVESTPVKASQEPVFRFGTNEAPATPFSFGISPVAAPMVATVPAIGTPPQGGGYNFNFGSQTTIQFDAGNSGTTMFSTGTGSTLPRRKRQVGPRTRSHR